MASNTREIRRRIKSVKSVGQITKAMELVSAAKMRRAQAAALSSRAYSKLTSELLSNLMGKVKPAENSVLLKFLPRLQNESARSLIIVISSDRGLAGALNTNLVNSAVKFARQQATGGQWTEKFDFITVGRKASDGLKRYGANIVAAFPGKDKNITGDDARAIADIATADFLKEVYGKVFVVYTDFISTLVQRPGILQVLPVTSAEAVSKDEYLFEPSPEKVLESLLFRAIEFILYQALVEAAASEHSARMVAMRNANQESGRLVGDLTLLYNQARQGAITRELSEISAAKLAMEG